MKRLICVTLAVMLLTAALTVPVFADVSDSTIADTNIRVRIDGDLQTYDVAPVIVNDRTLVPLRGIFEALSAEVNWDGGTQTVTGVKDDTNVALKIGDSSAEVNGQPYELDAPAMIVNNRTMVPARFISESLGAIVDWDETRRIVDIYTVSKEIYDWLKKIDAMYTREILEWIVDVYDPEEGGFYYAYSSRDHEEFGPDLESTWQAISIMQNSGIITSGNPPEEIMPQWLKDKLVDFAQKTQDPDDGYFYNPKIGKNIKDSRRERDRMWGNGIITKFGAQPLYTLPGDRVSGAEVKAVSTESNEGVPDYLKSAEGLRAWLAALPWETNAYSAANTAIAAHQSINDAGLENVVVEYLAEIQNPETGFWGPTAGYAGLNAAMKASGYFHTGTIPYPHLDEMLDHLITAMNEEIPNTASALWNPLTLIKNAKESYGGVIEPELQAKIDENIAYILEFEYNNLQRFKKNDGAYSYYERTSISTSQGAPVSYGLVESDMNATNLCTVKMRNDCYALVGITPTPFWDIYRDWLWEELKNKEPIEKEKTIEYGGTFEEDFESYEIGKTPKSLIADTRSGTVTVEKDPDRQSNKILKITSDKTALTSAIFNISSVGKSDKTTVSFKMRMETGEPAPIYYVELGKTAFSLVFDNSKGTDTFNYNYRTSGDEMGTKISDLNLDEWYDIKIVYETDGKTAKSRFYVDGALVMTAEDYYNGGDATVPPCEAINYFKAAAWSNRSGVLYIDNIKIDAGEVREK